MENILEIVREALRKDSDEKHREASQHYFKERIQFYGVKNPKVHKIASELSGQIKA